MRYLQLYEDYNLSKENVILNNILNIARDE